MTLQLETGVTKAISIQILGEPNAFKGVDKISILKSCAQTMVMRGRYVARLTYWTVRHRSIETARWIVAFEGL